MANHTTASLNAPHLKQQPVSVTRKMAASLPGLRKIAEERGLTIHHLGAGYPHPEVTDPTGYIQHKERFFSHLDQQMGINDGERSETLREAYNYTDTLGPVGPREDFASVYGADWGFTINPDHLLPTVGASGGINLCCSLFERPGIKVAYITDAPTYAGFLARATLNDNASIYSVEMDDEGPIPETFRAQILKAREDGYFVPFYYTVPDGHNPAGFSFSQARREAILAIAKEEGILIIEDAPYVYINYTDAGARPSLFASLDPKQTIHLFTGSKIGLPGPRVGFLYTDAVIAIDGEEVDAATLLLTESSADVLFHNPEALRGFQALLRDDSFETRESLWPVAEDKLAVYRENRAMMLDIFEDKLGDKKDRFHWTVPGAGFFSVFRFKNPNIRTDDAFIQKLVSEYGIVVIPMYDFYPPDARHRDANAGMSELRVSFCFSERSGDDRRDDMRAAMTAFCEAAIREDAAA